MSGPDSVEINVLQIFSQSNFFFKKSFFSLRSRQMFGLLLVFFALVHGNCFGAIQPASNAPSSYLSAPGASEFVKKFFLFFLFHFFSFLSCVSLVHLVWQVPRCERNCGYELLSGARSSTLPVRLFSEYVVA